MSTPMKLSLLWNSIGQGHCTYRGKGYIGKPKIKCSHPFSLTFVCEYTFCPLIQPQYATVVRDGLSITFVKKVDTPSPRETWSEAIELPEDKEQAINLIKSEIKDMPSTIQEQVLKRYELVYNIVDSLRIRGLEEEE